MKRRKFLKGFLAATGTLAVAPALALKAPERFNVSAGGGSITGFHADIIITDYISEDERKELKRMIINLPPQHGKSVFIHQRFHESDFLKEQQFRKKREKKIQNWQTLWNSTNPSAS